jgi:hypothetical protein|tara:strand:+ start:328 stop:537 length:210 start_codon:yes stop_codon:yes gene_type:complete
MVLIMLSVQRDDNKKPKKQLIVKDIRNKDEKDLLYRNYMGRSSVSPLLWYLHKVLEKPELKISSRINRN